MTQIRFPFSVWLYGRATLEGCWEYRTADPWAVTLHLDGQRWIFARDLLRVGLTEPAGDGDVQVMPDTGGSAGLLNVLLSSPSGAVRLPVARDTVASLLEASYALIPDGREAEGIDWDHEWTRLADDDATGAAA
ncbi:SsgA family sporulation/cell division regulator [Amycolatopsis sp. NBC_00348]|uniref:SsgA family sporulation/cell division regulator n=1 Tax=unclassified Amycolatopsis TaxID=2618356 RepID=UPI002E26F47B|nr:MULTISPECIES: SsgA family sporulation/cell division regulator [unclassified Amycolatopsis]